MDRLYGHALPSDEEFVTDFHHGLLAALGFTLLFTLPLSLLTMMLVWIISVVGRVASAIDALRLSTRPVS